MSNDIPNDLIHAAFFFVDIVGLSNPILSTQTQRTKIKVLNESIYNCRTFLSYNQDDLFILPTGDGMLIGFKDGLEEPLKLAQEMHEKLQKYNQTCPKTEKIQVRIGCNVGYVFIVKDAKGRVNLWGPGAILARRVMDLGDEDHVLVTSILADDLIEISKEYSKILHPIQDYKMKHGEDILLFSAYNEQFGNPTLPKKIQSGYSYNEEESTAKNAICDKIIFNVILKDENSNFLKHERTYNISNYNTEPIYEFTAGILTNFPHSFEDLGVKIFENNDEIKAAKIFVPTQLSKQILVKFTKAILKNQSKIINVNYVTKEISRHFEHIFLNVCNEFELNFIFPTNSPTIKPRLYLVDNKNITKAVIECPSAITKGLSSKMCWIISHGVNKKDLIRLEW